MPGITAKTDSLRKIFTERLPDFQYGKKAKIFHCPQHFRILPSYEAYTRNKIK